MLLPYIATLELTGLALSSGLLPTLGRHHMVGQLSTLASESLDPTLP